jgi:hypothetical protein
VEGLKSSGVTVIHTGGHDCPWDDDWVRGTAGICGISSAELVTYLESATDEALRVNHEVGVDAPLPGPQTSEKADSVYGSKGVVVAVYSAVCATCAAAAYALVHGVTTFLDPTIYWLQRDCKVPDDNLQSYNGHRPSGHIYPAYSPQYYFSTTL